MIAVKTEIDQFSFDNPILFIIDFEFDNQIANIICVLIEKEINSNFERFFIFIFDEYREYLIVIVEKDVREDHFNVAQFRNKSLGLFDISN
jgi:hypothetical protein